MSEPENPAQEGEKSYTLPPWIDDAIVRSKGDEALSGSGGEPESLTTASAEPGAAAPPLRTGDDAIAPFSPRDSEEAMRAPAGEPALAAAHRNQGEIRRKKPPDAMPWLIAALFFTAAALTLAWFIWMRPAPE